MSLLDRLKVIVSSLVIFGFILTFSWGFYTTWTKSSSIAQAQKVSADAERDREDAVRRYEKAKADVATAKDDKDAHARDVKLRAVQVEESTRRAAEATAAASGARSDFTDNVNYLATALAGLIGTVVASMFGQELGENKARAAPGAQAVAAANHLLIDVGGWRNKLSTFYAITYFLFGFIAIATWAFSLYSPEMIKNLATISLTLLLAIARSFFN